MEKYQCPGCKGVNYTSLTFGKVFCAYCGNPLIIEQGKCRLAGGDKRIVQPFFSHLSLVKNKTE